MDHSQALQGTDVRANSTLGNIDLLNELIQADGFGREVDGGKDSAHRLWEAPKLADAAQTLDEIFTRIL